MANPKVEQYVVPFEGNLLNTSKYNYDTKPFQGFNKLEGTYYQGCLSPFYKTERQTDNLVLVDNDNNEWEVIGKELFKNGVKVKTLSYSGKRIKKTEIKKDGIIAYLKNGSIDVIVCYNNETLQFYSNDNLLSEIPYVSDYDIEVHTVTYNNGNTMAVLIGTSLIIKIENNTVDILWHNYREDQGNYISEIDTPTEHKYISFIYGINRSLIITHIGYEIKGIPITGSTYDSLTNVTIPEGQDGYWDLDVYSNAGFFYDGTNTWLYIRQNNSKESTKPIASDGSIANSHHMRECICPIIVKCTLSLGNHIQFADSHDENGGAYYIAPENTKEPNYLKLADIKTHVVRTETTVMGSLRYSLMMETSKEVGGLTTSYIPSGEIIGKVGGAQFIGSKTYQTNALFQDDGNFLDGSFETKGNFRILANNGFVSNISVTKDEKHQGTIVENWNTIDSNAPIFINNDCAAYKTLDNKFYLVEIEEAETPEIKVFLGRYIYFNDAEGLNAYDTVSEKEIRIGSDWNNSYITTKVDRGKKYDTLLDTGYNYRYFDKFHDTEKLPLSSAGWFPDESTKDEVQNTNISQAYEIADNTSTYPTYETKGWIATAVNQHYQITGINAIGRIDNPMPVHAYKYEEPSELLGSKADKWYNFVNFFYDELSSSPAYTKSYNYERTYSIQLEGTSYPTDVNGNNLLNISPSVDEIDNNYLLYSSIKLDDKRWAQLATISGENLFAYYNGTISYNVTELFTIAGMTYSIIANTIYASQVQNGIVNTIQPIVNCGGMKFLGALPLNALFYSFANKHIYSFTGDANLQDTLDISRFGDPKRVLMNTSSQEILLVYENETLVISNSGTYECPYGLSQLTDNKGKLWVTKNLVAFYDNGVLDKVAKYKIDDNFTVVPLKVETSYYGLRNNIISINDTMYFRLYNPNDEDGYIKLKAETLMNGIRTTDQKETKLVKDSFDKASNTYYGRFQPQLQKATSESFMVETTYPLATMIISNQPETVLIGSNGTGTQHNF